MGIKVSSNVRLPSLRLDGKPIEVTVAVTALAMRKGLCKPRANRTPSGSFVVDALNRHEATKPECIVIHTTGAGLSAREIGKQFEAWRRKHPEYKNGSTFDEGCWVYANAMDACPHVLIGQGGELARLVPDELIASHVGVRDSQAYSRKNPLAANIYRWWRERWPGLRSPDELAGGRLWRAASCNAISLGVEVACPVEDPTGPWSEAAWLRLARQVVEWSTAYNIPIDTKYIFTHSDAHPISRTSKGKPYDPGPRQWPGFEQLARYVEKVIQKG